MSPALAVGPTGQLRGWGSSETEAQELADLAIPRCRALLLARVRRDTSYPYGRPAYRATVTQEAS